MGEEKRNQEYASSFSEDSVSPGRLKIFFGYAAGVGKTYAMLEAAHQAQKEGINVVYGDNESGKSTVHTFLLAMFFGLRRRRGKAPRLISGIQIRP